MNLGRDALLAYERADWELAYRKFEQAEEVAHSPVFLLYMARSKQRSGAWLAARRIYERLLQGTHAGIVPDAWRTALDTARAEYLELAEYLPTIVVRLEGAKLSEVTLTIDGSKLSAGSGEISVDPGSHVIVARTSAGVEARQSFTIQSGQKRVPVQLELPGGVASPPEARFGRAVRSEANSAGAPQNARRSAPPAAYVVGGAGLAGLLLGMVAGGLAWAELQELKGDCDGAQCDSKHASRMDSVKRLATIADISVAVGAAGLAGSAVLFWWVPDASGAAPRASGLLFRTQY